MGGREQKEVWRNIGWVRGKGIRRDREGFIQEMERRNGR